MSNELIKLINSKLPKTNNFEQAIIEAINQIQNETNSFYNISQDDIEFIKTCLLN